MNYLNGFFADLNSAQIMLLGLACIGIGVGLYFSFVQREPAKMEFDWSRLKGDVDRREYVEDRLDERLSKIQSPDQFGTDIMLEQKGKLAILIVLQIISAGITFWFWNKAGDGYSAKVMAGAFGLFNALVLPYALGKADRSVIAAVMSFGIIFLSFLASSGLASMTTNGKARASKLADADRQRYEEHIKTREKTLLGIDQSVSRESLEGKKAIFETKKSALLAMQVRYTAKALRRHRGVRGGTLSELTNSCENPWPVRRAGALCKQVGEFKAKISAVQRRIDALGSAARLRAEIVLLERKRDKKSSKTISDPLAPIRSVLPVGISAMLGDLRSVLIGAVGEIVFNGYAFLFMGDVLKTGQQRWKNARRKAFRELVLEAQGHEASVAEAAPADEVDRGDGLAQMAQLGQRMADQMIGQQADRLGSLRDSLRSAGKKSDVKAYFADRIELTGDPRPLGARVVYDDYLTWATHRPGRPADISQFVQLFGEQLGLRLPGRDVSGVENVDGGEVTVFRHVSIRLALVSAG